MWTIIGTWRMAKEGVEEGIEKTKKDIARNMKKKNYSIKDIAEITGLSIDEIEKI